MIRTQLFNPQLKRRSVPKYALNVDWCLCSILHLEIPSPGLNGNHADKPRVGGLGTGREESGPFCRVMRLISPPQDGELEISFYIRNSITYRVLHASGPNYLSSLVLALKFGGQERC